MKTKQNSIPGGTGAPNGLNWPSAVSKWIFGKHHNQTNVHQKTKTEFDTQFLITFQILQLVLCTLKNYYYHQNFMRERVKKFHQNITKWFFGKVKVQ